MRKILSILILSIGVTFSFGLNAQKLNASESELLNKHFESTRGNFDFTGKQVAFFLSTSPWSKKEFFQDLTEWNQNNQRMSNEFIILTDDQKEYSGGYDVFIYSWSKALISKKQVASHIEKLKKHEANNN